MENKNMYGFVYITTNSINGKKYIGQKRYDKANKWKSYLGSGIHLKRAINKYGSENFSKEIIEDCETKECLDKREKYWIEYYNAVKSDEFYNIASGGEGGDTRAGYSVEQLRQSEEFRKERLKESLPRGEKSGVSKLTELQVLEIIQRLKDNDFTTDIATDYCVATETISSIRNRKTWTHLTKDIVFDDISYHRKERTRKTKPVIQYDENGEYIAAYKSARIAEQETGISYKLISAVCNGQKRIAHGFIWRFEGDSFNKYNTENINFVKVDQYDKDGTFIKTWDSEKEVMLSMGIHLYSVLSGRCNSAGGFYWCKHGEKFSVPEYKREGRKLV